MRRQCCIQVSEDTKQKLSNGDGAGPKLLGAEAALRVVAEQLPKIVPNMLINKRDGKDCCPNLQHNLHAALNKTSDDALLPNVRVHGASNT